MRIIGLTGSIGMGKSTAALHFRARGVMVFDADAAVHALYAGAAVAPIEAAFPGVTVDGVIDRGRLSAQLGGSSEHFRRLEAIVHPLVQAEERTFLHEAYAGGASLAVLEVPLLFETGLDAKVDGVVVVSAPPNIQAARVLARAGMTEEKFAHIVRQQTPDAEKRERADFVVDTSTTIAATHAQIDTILSQISRLPEASFDAHWQS